MTGKELIMYILENDLEGIDIFKEALLTEKEAAIQFGVAKATVKAWRSFGLLKGLNIKGEPYIFKNQTDPRELMDALGLGAESRFTYI